MALQNVLKTCSDPINRQILDLLREQSMNAGEIATSFFHFRSSRFPASERFKDGWLLSAVSAAASSWCMN